MAPMNTPSVTITIVSLALLLCALSAPAHGFLFPSRMHSPFAHHAPFPRASFGFPSAPALRTPQQQQQLELLQQQQQQQRLRELESTAKRVREELEQLSVKREASVTEANRLYQLSVDYGRSRDVHQQAAQTLGDLRLARRYDAAAREALSRARGLAETVRRIDARAAQLRRWLEQRGLPLAATDTAAAEEPATAPAQEARDARQEQQHYAQHQRQHEEQVMDQHRHTMEPQQHQQHTQQHQAHHFQQHQHQHTHTHTHTHTHQTDAPARPSKQRRENVGGSLPAFEVDSAGLQWQAGGLWVGLPGEQRQNDFESRPTDADLHREAVDVVEELLRAR